MHAAQQPLLQQPELLPSGELPLARGAGKTGQVVRVALRPTHPVVGVDVPAAARTPSPVPPEEARRGERDRVREPLTE